jgi:hypothetical protein
MYGTVAGWIAYAAARGLTVADNAAAAAALVRASDYIRTRYVIRFSADYDDSAPQVEESAYIAAAYELETPGFWSATFTPSQVKVLTKVGGIQWTPVQMGGLSASDAMTPVSPAIDALLTPLTRWGMPAAMTV